MNLLQKFQSAQTEYRNFMNDLTKDENLKTLFTELFEQYKLDAIVLFGYTPGFNDGDPCYHSGDEVYCNQELEEYMEDDIYDARESDFEDHKFAFHMEDHDYYINEYVNELSYSSEEHQVFRATLSLINELLEERYTTDYKITVYRHKDEGVVFEYEDYDCGY